MSSSVERVVLDPSALLSILPSLLPTDGKRLASPTAALAALAHSIMTALEFRLVAIDDDSASAHADSNALPAQWSTNPSAFTLRYKHNQSSLEFVIKVSRLGGRTLFNAITDATDKVASYDLQTTDFTSAAAFPYDLETGGPLVHAFISSARVTDFATSFKTQILQKIMPGLRKDGYQERSEAVVPPSSSSGQRPAPAQPRPATPPQPFDPGQPFGMPRFGQPTNPLEVGRRDREPLGGAFGPPGFGPPIGPPGGGMFVGPDDPLFHGGNGHPHRGGPWGGDGFLPPMGAPPGARFDPIGPFGGPPGAPRPPRQPRGDNDEFMPPGFGSDMII